MKFSGALVMQSIVFSVPLPNLKWNIQQLEIAATLFPIIDTSTMLFCYYIAICDGDLILIFFTSKSGNQCDIFLKASEFFLSGY